MKKIIAAALCLIIITGLVSCGQEHSGERAVSMQISTSQTDVEYMLGTDLTVFGAAPPVSIDDGAELSLVFTSFEAFETDDRLFLVSGTGELDAYGQKYYFDIDEEIMGMVTVSENNTVYESILGSTITVGERPVEISIDFVADEDFSQAVATVSAEDGMLFFGDIFNDYLEYFNMVIAGVQQ